MENDDPINKIIDARNQFKLKKINAARENLGLPPVTENELQLSKQIESAMADSDKISAELIQFNKERASKGLPPVKVEDFLTGNIKESPPPLVFKSNVVKGKFEPKPVDTNVTPSYVSTLPDRNPKVVLSNRQLEEMAEKTKLAEKQASDTVKHIDFGGPASLAEENASKLKASEYTDLDAKTRRWKGKLPAIGDRMQFEMDLQRIKDLKEKAEKFGYDSFEKKLYEQQADEILQNLNSQYLEKTTKNAPPEFNAISLDYYKKMQELAKRREEIDKMLKESEPRQLAFEQSRASEKLNYLKSRNPSGRVSVDYGDFKTPLEKGIDSAAKALKLDNLKQIAMDAPKMAGKALQYAAPPLAAYDLFWNKPRESAEEIRKKGLAQDLSEIGLDIAALGAPAARLAGKAALGAGLDMAAMPLGGYLLGKQFFPGNEPRDPNAPEMPEDEQYSPIYAPSTGLANIPGADEMRHFKDIKSLLKK